MELLSLRAVPNCATLRSPSSRTALFPLLCCSVFKLGTPPPVRLSCPPPVCRNASLLAQAKKRDSYAQPVTKQNKTIEDDEEFDSDEEFYEDDYDDEDKFEFDEEEVGEAETGGGGEEEEEEEDEDEDDEDGYLDDEILFEDGDDKDFDDGIDLEDFGDVIEAGPRKAFVGDGGDGGGIAVGSIPWEKEALSIAEELIEKSFNGDFRIYAFKTSPRFIIYIRIEKLSSKYGSPTIDDIEAFSIAYREQLDKAVAEERMPANIAFEISSPGVERLLRIPEDLERFKERPMYVKYITDDGPALDPPKELDGIFSLISYDMELGQCIWGIADVKANRTGKGRPLNKKQREWRLTTPFESLRLVRLHSDC